MWLGSNHWRAAWRGSSPPMSCLTPRPLQRVDKGFGPAGDRHQSTVDRRSWGECGRRNTLQHIEVEPRPPLGRHHGGTADAGPAPRHLPLHQQHRVGPAGAVQDPPQDRRRQVKRQIADDHMRGVREPVMQEVGRDDAGARQCACIQPCGLLGVDLDRGQRTLQALQRQRQRTGAGADFDDRAIGTGDGVDDRRDNGAVAQEVLAVLVTAWGEDTRDSAVAGSGSLRRRT